MQLEEAKKIIHNIDDALVRLYTAKAVGYTFFNFYDQLEKLLHFARGIEELRHKIEDYVSIFTDLQKPVAREWSKIKQIKEQEKSIIWERSKLYFSKGEVEVREEEITFPEESFLRILKYYSLGDSIRNSDSVINKYEFYLEGITYWSCDGAKPVDIASAEMIFKEDCIELFKRNGYTTWPVNSVLTFEKYASWKKDDTPKEKIKSEFKISDKRGSRTDLIKILYAMYHLNLVKYEKDGTIPLIKDFINDCGKFFGIDLTEYHTDMAQFKSQSDETVLKVFSKMENTILNYARDAKE